MNEPAKIVAKVVDGGFVDSSSPVDRTIHPNRRIPRRLPRKANASRGAIAPAALVLWVLCTVGTGCAQPNGRDGIDALSTARGDARGEAVPSGDALANTGADDAPPKNNVDLPRFPSISPDGSAIVFSWRGDLWRIGSAGGAAVRLTTHRGDELRSAWSRDGRRIAFESNRNGYRNLYLMNSDGTEVRQVTDTDRPCTLVGFGTDPNGGEVLLFDSTLEGDLYRSPRPYMISVNGGDMVRVHDAFGAHPAASPDGSSVAFTRGQSSWNRRHYRGPDARNVWLFHTGIGAFTQLTDRNGNDGSARWAGEDTLLFLSDRELGAVNLYRMDAAKGDRSAERLTAFAENDVQDFDVSADGRTVVLTVWDRMYTLSLSHADAEPVPIVVVANEDEADNYEVKTIDREVSEAALSPDGKVMAFVAYGEVYVRNVEEKSPTVRVTNHHARDRDIAWSPDGLKLYFVSDRDGTESIYAARVALTRDEVKEEFEKATNPEKEKEKGEDEAKEMEEEDDAESDPDNEANDDEGDGDAGDEDGEDPDDDDDDEAKPKKKKKDKKKKLPKELDPDRWRDVLKVVIEPAVVAASHDRNPSPSPDGKSLAFKRGRGDLMVLDLDSNEVRKLVDGWDTRMGWRWSPDSRHIAYNQSDMNFNADIWITPADASAPAVNVTRHPDNDLNPRFSADGKILSFISERVNEEYDLWMVYLDADMESWTDKELEDYYKQAAKAAKKRKPLKVEVPDDAKQDKQGDETSDADGADDNGD
ncbi:MAG: PD40 domain-containing protein, partial [Planctomycetes bacterium]|nr:PD40 domain-containing protein [Planctomycetota bacterium]